jgi:hypothetical protein
VTLGKIGVSSVFNENRTDTKVLDGKKPLHGEGQHRRHGTMVSQDGRNPSAWVPFLMWAILASLGRCANLTHQ